MNVVLISDTHGDHLELDLPDGDLLIHAGDISSHGTPDEIDAFVNWFDALDYTHKILIAGNHDRSLESDASSYHTRFKDLSFHYLDSDEVVINGWRFWGSPITPRFFDWAFMLNEGEPLREHWSNIPENTDVLITHGPPYGIMDVVHRDSGELVHAGCRELLSRIKQIKPVMHLFGHIHEGYGHENSDDIDFYNISSMNEHYEMQNPPVVIQLPESR